VSSTPPLSGRYTNSRSCQEHVGIALRRYNILTTLLSSCVATEHPQHPRATCDSATVCATRARERHIRCSAPPTILPRRRSSVSPKPINGRLSTLLHNAPLDSYCRNSGTKRSSSRTGTSSTGWHSWAWRNVPRADGRLSSFLSPLAAVFC
jgi:hypothetical protein